MSLPIQLYCFLILSMTFNLSACPVTYSGSPSLRRGRQQGVRYSGQFRCLQVHSPLVRLGLHIRR